MLKYDLSYYRYRLQIVQELKETNFVRWKDFCQQFLHLQLPEDTELFLGKVRIWNLNGCVNK